jgi:membrane associated rhomboid family serine protease
VVSETDFTKLDESELVELFGRMDPRWAPVDCARVKDLLVERGYIVQETGLGPGSVAPSPGKMQALIGSNRPIEYRVAFNQTAGLFSLLERARNQLNLSGTGTLEADGVCVWLSGRPTGLLGFQRQVALAWRRIVDVESEGNVFHFVYHDEASFDSAITLWLPDAVAAEQLVKVLPKTRTSDFRPQLKAIAEFERVIVARSPHTPVTVALVAINTLVFLASAVSGRSLVTWGANFGPFTTDGDWWRLFTSLFFHATVVHLVFNVLPLAAFGPLTERLYGSLNYLLIYLVAGMTGGLVSISWRPDVNSVGASGAIFGILGALLASQWRVGETFPRDIMRPLRDYTLVFAGYALLSGFMSKGVDNGAHLGGLAAGVLLGVATAHPLSSERRITILDFRRYIQATLLTVAFAGIGVWCAQRASGSLVGEGLYWHTVHWFRAGERSANSEFNAALALTKTDKLSQAALAARLQGDVLPFWREASARTSEDNLGTTPPNLLPLELIHTVSESKVRGYQLLSDGLLRNNPQEVAAGNLELKRGEDMVREWQTANR